ncbi:MAG: glycerophosphodiester phosphodiesterase, partial [Ilumatobacteraceae bacterium]|nr:glycerophosphodiester phosphodiesterase [Ilumatobacteraceae bacterium]
MTRATVTFVSGNSGAAAVSAIPAGPGRGCAVLAHRGASRAERENTLAAFARAGDMGADAVELDVRRSADGHLVVHHDAHLADGRVIVRTTRVELPAEVPSLDAALDACHGMWVNVEIKNDPGEADFDHTDDIAVAVADALRRRDEAVRFLVSSFRQETIDRFRSAAPDIATAWLTPGIDDDDMATTFGSLRGAGHAAVHPWFGLVTKRFIDEAHSSG